MSGLIQSLRDMAEFRHMDRSQDAIDDIMRESADRIEELERQLDRFRSNRSYIISFNDGWSSAVEEAAAYHDDLAAQHNAVAYESDHHERMVKEHRRFAKAIRALSDSSPTLLQEQKDNDGKEGE